MTGVAEPAPRATGVCPGCGRRFGCEPAGACWCKTLDFALPLPQSDAAACFCPDCLAARKPVGPPASP